MTKLLTLMLFASSTLFASQAPRTFEKTFGGKENDIAKAVVKTDDGYLIVGEKETVSSRYNDVWVLKVDLDGKF
jgi:hypothetical protein